MVCYSPPVTKRVILIALFEGRLKMLQCSDTFGSGSKSMLQQIVVYVLPTRSITSFRCLITPRTFFDLLQLLLLTLYVCAMETGSLTY